MAKHADAAERQLNGSSGVVEDLGQIDEPTTEREADDNAETDVEPRVRNRLSGARPAIAVGLTAIVALGSLTGWLGYRTYETRHAQAQRNELVKAARQAAVNLTTIAYTEVEADIKRILDSSVGSFHDDFQRRSQPFVDVVKQLQSESEGTVTAAGLESQTGDQAQVLVTLSVKTSTAAAPEQAPRAWRMRISIEKVGEVAKVSDVRFVP